MAKYEKKEIPPIQRQITVPQTLEPLMQAFHVDSEEAIKTLVINAANAIYGSNELGFGKKSISSEEIDGIVSLIKGINPKDALETLYAAQIIAAHMLGMRKLSSIFQDDQKLGLKLLRFSNEAMQHLQKKRDGGLQNITVNYNYHSQGLASTKPILIDKGDDDANSRS
ncbi:hypothetical protein BN1013_00705 [Candidatus Rubidus massiliensis]|nr:hypothetical protein BN1013_00705 [Candidatus Rubidus massiliensis]